MRACGLLIGVISSISPPSSSNRFPSGNTPARRIASYSSTVNRCGTGAITATTRLRRATGTRDTAPGGSGVDQPR